MEDSVKKYLSSLGKIGGKSRSRKKVLAGKRNIKKAMAARWPKNEDSK